MTIGNLSLELDSESAVLLGSDALHRFYFTRYGDALAFVRGVILAALGRGRRLEMEMCDLGVVCVTVGLANVAGASFGEADRELLQLIELGAAAAGLDLTA